MSGDICIVMPVYRHGREAQIMARRLQPFGLRVFLVDDGNDLETAELLSTIPADNQHVTLVRRARNGGKGAAVLSGLEAARQAGFSQALQVDSDGQHDIKDIPAFVQAAQLKPAATFIGQPQFDASAPLGRKIGRQVTRAFVWLETLSFSIQDAMCGFRVYPIDTTLAVAQLNPGLGLRMDFDIEILVRLHWAGVPIVSMPTKVIYPENGSSNFRLFQDNWLISCMHTRLLLGMLARLFTGRMGQACPA